mmetsp:Transcript_91920/g.297327  ORF Transcript_91920/g.297327 Transcript_91920/m.297327 type:complete len:329 (+) Transcript_91920:1103-2089(+)
MASWAEGEGPAGFDMADGSSLTVAVRPRRLKAVFSSRASAKTKTPLLLMVLLTNHSSRRQLLVFSPSAMRLAPSSEMRLLFKCNSCNVEFIAIILPNFAAASLPIELPPSDTSRKELFTSNISAILEAPASPTPVPCSDSVCNEALTCSTSARAIAPLSPMALPCSDSARKDELLFRAFASTAAPFGPMALQCSWSSRRLVLTSRASERWPAPVSEMRLKSKSRDCTATSGRLNILASASALVSPRRLRSSWSHLTHGFKAKFSANRSQSRSPMNLPVRLSDAEPFAISSKASSKAFSASASVWPYSSSPPLPLPLAQLQIDGIGSPA